ncbi:MAG: translation initiation factor IF-2 subunit gamma [bacterium]|nr:translation initiation factor IF-2 subunit gamma [bacterium]
MRLQPVMNIGTAGHVDHGKTTLLQALTGEWTDKHSEEIKRGITIKLGYADLFIYKCKEHDVPEAYASQAFEDRRCRVCGKELELARIVSFVDSPGHESLMTVMLSGAAVMDAALLVIAANEPCPRPQTKEHLKALQLLGIKKILVVQNKIDLVKEEEAIKNYEQIEEFLKTYGYEHVPIIPVSASHRANIDALIQAIYKYLEPPEKPASGSPLMLVVRTFDVNKSGTPIEQLKGGVLGGAILRGKFKIGEEIEIRPGIFLKSKNAWQPLYSRIVSLRWRNYELEEAAPGGLISIGTLLDPTLTKSDRLAGQVVGLAGEVPEPLQELVLEVHLLERYVGLEKEVHVENLKPGEQLLLNVGTASTLGMVKKVSGETAEIVLRKPVVAEPGWRVAISRNVGNRWRLAGYGIVK